jgi:hypothetical protein
MTEVECHPVPGTVLCDMSVFFLLVANIRDVQRLSSARASLLPGRQGLGFRQDTGSGSSVSQQGLLSAPHLQHTSCVLC